MIQPGGVSMRAKFTIEEIRSRTYKPRDAWWTVILVDPLASRLVQLTAGYRWATPNLLTAGAFLLGLGAAGCFAMGDASWLIVGAIIFHFSFVLDCMDGKMARLMGNGSVFGAWLDYIFDRLRVVVCTVALMGGQYAKTDELMYVVLGGVVIFLDMFRYLNALEIGKVKGDMLNKLAEARGGRDAAPVFVEDVAHEHPVGAAVSDELAEGDRPVVDVYADFRSRFGAFVQFRNFLVRKRIRAHVISGIEFQMAVFILGPLTGFIVASSLIAGALLLAFELLLIYKLWLATHAFGRELAKVKAEAEQAEAAAADATAGGQLVADGTDITGVIGASVIPGQRKSSESAPATPVH